MNPGKQATTARKHTSERSSIIRRRPIIGRNYSPSSQSNALSVLYVSRHATFLSLVNRTIKIIDAGPGGAKWSATKAAGKKDSIGIEASNNKARSLQQKVRLVAAGHAIQNLVLVAAWFQRNPAYAVRVRTRWSATVDDIFSAKSDGSCEGEDEIEHPDGHQEVELQNEQKSHGEQDGKTRKDTRLRNVSFLELTVLLN